MKQYNIIPIFFLFLAVNSCTSESEVINSLFFENEETKLDDATVTDFDGNIYHTITIGDQTWMVENLRSTHYADGTPIKEYFAPNGNEANIEQYGKLYSFSDIMRNDSTEGVQGLCPNGWHVPTADEIKKLVHYLKAKSDYLSLTDQLCSNFGWSIKNGKNKSGFSAVPNGFKTSSQYEGFGEVSTLWTSSIYQNKFGIFYCLSVDSTKYKPGFYFQNDAKHCAGIRCIKNTTNIKLPIVVIDSISSITGKPIVYAHISDKNNGIISKVGICYSLNSNPSLKDFLVKSVDLNGKFSCELTKVIPNTTYYVKAFATHELGTGYSKEFVYNTTVFVPDLSEISVSNIKANSASFITTVLSDGGSSVTAKGVCWSLSENPTTNNSKTNEGIGSGTYTSVINGLAANTTYFVRSYATNSKGTVYNNQKFFITLPTVNVNNVSDITYKSAKISASLPPQGSNTINEYGICWGIATEPTINANKIKGDNLNNSDYSCVLTGLEPETKYYIRAYVSNDSGTNYSEQTTFTTPADPYTVSDGLLAFYNFDNQNANEAIGNFVGVINGGVTFVNSSTPNSKGFSASFDGTGLINIPYQILPTTGNWSVCMWVKTNFKSCVLFSTSYNSFQLSNNKLTLNADFYYWTYSYNVDLSTALLNNSWHLVTLTANGTSFKYYIDSVLFETMTLSSFLLTHNKTIIGAGSFDNAAFKPKFSGFIDNIRFYNKALTTNEISKLYNAKQ